MFAHWLISGSLNNVCLKFIISTMIDLNIVVAKVIFQASINSIYFANMSPVARTQYNLGAN